MKNTVLTLAASAFVLSAAPALADPPRHAPAHGYYKPGKQAKRNIQALRADTRVWRGDDGRYYCRRDDGTTGLLIGAAAGAVIGSEVAGRGDRTIGAILGGAAGAIVGRELDRDRFRCR